MPSLDYVSIVRSVYKDRRGMLLGGLACLIGVGTTAIKTGAPIFWVIGAGFVASSIYRYLDMTQFRQADIGPTDVEAAAKWELRATYGAMTTAFLCGLWCFCSFVFVNDAIAEILSVVTTVGCMVGVVTRNFGLDRLLTAQLGVAVILIVAGVMLKDDPYHWVLAALMLPLLVSYRFLAADVRKVLLSAVHGRVEATRLAEDLDAALHTMQHGLCMLDEHDIISLANDRALATFAELAPGEWRSHTFASLVAAAVAAGTLPLATAEELTHSVDQQKSSKVLVRLADEKYHEVTVSSRQQRTVLLFEDVTDRIKSAERIAFMARYDALTGLPNRAYFTEQVEADLARWRDGEDEEVASLMIIDLDDFKHVNDTEGHLVGDELLMQAAARLRQALGPKTILARLGGDEFITYRGGAPSAEQGMDAAQTALATFRAPFVLEGGQLAVNASVGLVTSSQHGDDLGVLMTRADLALYKSKARGKGQMQVFRDEMDVAYRYRQRLKAELAECVANNGLSLVYQPVIDLKTRRVVGCEALARWHHPELGTIPPSVFIPIAEESGLISDISRWVLMTATAECHNWPDEVRVAVNISAKDLRTGDVAQMVGTALASSGLPAHRLEIEVTETAVIEEREAAAIIFKTLAAQGIGIALDDFGTGYSSLSYLQALPFTKLKIDRSFILDIVSNPRSMKLLSNVAQLGKDIDLTVTAEGVETEEQLALITEHTKIDQIQGFLFGVPLPRRDVFELIVRLSTAPRGIPKKRKHG